MLNLKLNLNLLLRFNDKCGGLGFRLKFDFQVKVQILILRFTINICG